MKGTILDYSVQNNAGFISGDDGQRYSFVGSEWKSPSTPVRGGRVDFATQNDHAVQVFVAIGSPAGSGAKSKIAAALLAFFLGGIGIHKFYLGYTKAGVIMLLCGTLGWLIIAPGAAIAIIAFIEFIIYIVKSDEEFDRIYVQGKKEWF